MHCGDGLIRTSANLPAFLLHTRTWYICITFVRISETKTTVLRYPLESTQVLLVNIVGRGLWQSRIRTCIRSTVLPLDQQKLRY